MKTFAKYLFLAVMAAFTLAGCEKEKVNPILNPSGKPIKFAISAQTTSKTAATIKVTADYPVPSEVAIALALDETSTMTKGLTFPAKLVMAAGETEVSGNITVDVDKLDPGSNTTCVIAGSFSGVKFGTVEIFTIKTDPAPYVPKPDKDGFTADGDPSEWEVAEGVFTFDSMDGAPLGGLKMAKVHYGSNLHFLFEVTDAVLEKGIEDGKVRLHIFFDSDNKQEGGLMHKWKEAGIDYMLEGKMTSGGEYCAFSSNYQKWNGEEPTDWAWEDSGTAAKIIDSAGEGNYYEMTLDYSKFPGEGGLAKVIRIGFDIADGDYAVTGFLPNTDQEEPASMGLIWKSDYIFPDADGFTADGKDAEWKDREGVVEIKSVENAVSTGIASTKVFYGKNCLHFLVELTDEALAAEEVYLNLLFNGDGKADGMNYIWKDAGLKHLLSAIIAKGGKYVPFSSPYYRWAGVTYPTEWGWNSTDIWPLIQAAGSGKLYEISVDYSTYPGGLADEFGFATVINDQAGAILGYLPNTDDEAEPADVQVVTKMKDITIDGKADDWAKLNKDFVTVIECPEAAELKGLKSAKVYYDDKLYMLLEVTDDALAKGVTDGKLRFHIFFNSTNGTGLGTSSRWTNFNYATEGKMTSGGSYCDYSSSVYAIAPGTAWDTSNTGVAPKFVAKGEGNLYELSMDYSDFPEGLADTFRIGFDIADGGYEVISYLPYAAEPCDLALVKKANGVPEVGPEPVEEGIVIDGKFEDWEEIEGVSDGNYGMFKVASDENNLYFFSYRNTGGRYTALWGDGVGYIYIGLDLDNNLETGVELLGNGNYEAIWYFYCFGGTAEAPYIGITAEGEIAPDTYSMANLKVKGVVSEDGARLEYSIPRADLPEIPASSITVYSWGNKDLTKVSIEAFL